jgi:serine/threonine protein kinase HipA of HipAB toxin-antitoxin module
MRIDKTVQLANNILMHRINSVKAVSANKEQLSQQALNEKLKEMELRRQMKERREKSMEQLLQAHS